MAVNIGGELYPNFARQKAVDTKYVKNADGKNVDELLEELRSEISSGGNSSTGEASGEIKIIGLTKVDEITDEKEAWLKSLGMDYVLGVSESIPENSILRVYVSSETSHDCIEFLVVNSIPTNLHKDDRVVQNYIACTITPKELVKDFTITLPSPAYVQSTRFINIIPYKKTIVSGYRLLYVGQSDYANNLLGKYLCFKPDGYSYASIPVVEKILAISTVNDNGWVSYKTERLQGTFEFSYDFGAVELLDSWGPPETAGETIKLQVYTISSSDTTLSATGEVYKYTYGVETEKGLLEDGDILEFKDALGQRVVLRVDMLRQQSSNNGSYYVSVINGVTPTLTQGFQNVLKLKGLYQYHVSSGWDSNTGLVEITILSNVCPYNLCANGSLGSYEVSAAYMSEFLTKILPLKAPNEWWPASGYLSSGSTRTNVIGCEPQGGIYLESGNAIAWSTHRSWYSVKCKFLGSTTAID